MLRIDKRAGHQEGPGESESPHSVTASFYLSDLQVDPLTGTVRGPGAEVRLEPRVMSVLQLLASSPGSLVSRENLLQANWGGGDTYDEALTQSIYQLRQQLVIAGGSEAYRKLVTTVPKRGYLLQGEVRAAPALAFEAAMAEEKLAVAAPAEPLRTRVLDSRRTLLLSVLALVVAVLVTAALRLNHPTGSTTTSTSTPAPVRIPVPVPATIAVLPFTNLSEQADSEILADGLAEEVLGALARNPDLRVIARGSAFQFRGEQSDMRDVGQQLGVRYVVDGSLRDRGGQVHIRTRLTDTTTGKQVWSDQYDRSRGNWLELQEMVAAEVSQALAGVLQQHQGKLSQAAGPTNTEAYLEVLRARQLLASRSVPDAEQAIEHLQRALLLDPNYALAYARLADAILIQAESSGGIGAVRQVVAPLLEKALELDPAFGEAYALRSMISDDPGQVERDLRRGLELNPSFARGYELLSNLHMTRPFTELELAIDAIDHAIALDPLSPGLYHTKAGLLMGLGYWEQVIELNRRALELNPNFRAALVQLAQVVGVQGHYAEAIDYARRAVALDPRAVPVRDQLTRLYLTLGDVDAARAANIPPTEEGNRNILWAEGRGAEIAEAIYRAGPDARRETNDIIVSQAVLEQALADGDYQRAIDLMTSGLPYPGELPPAAAAWGLYPYANLSQLYRASGDEDLAMQLQRQLEERMALSEAYFPRHHILYDQFRAVFYAGAGLNDDACAALERTFSPRPRPFWRVILANPAFAGMRDAPCMKSLQSRSEKYIASERQRIDAAQRAGGEQPAAGLAGDRAEGAPT